MIALASKGFEAYRHSGGCAHDAWVLGLSGECIEGAVPEPDDDGILDPPKQETSSVDRVRFYAGAALGP